MAQPCVTLRAVTLRCYAAERMRARAAAAARRGERQRDSVMMSPHCCLIYAAIRDDTRALMRLFAAFRHIVVTLLREFALCYSAHC